MRYILRLTYAFVLTYCCALAASAQVIITEFMADNKHTLADENGDYSDWIELYNPGTASVNLGGWALTDDVSRKTRWFLPATNLAAKGFLVVFASGKNRSLPGAPLHTDFKLNADGEYLALLKPGGAIASDFGTAFPPQRPDVSYGLAQDVTTNTFLIAGANAKYLIPSDNALGLAWTTLDFDDSSWFTGPTGLGYETAVAGFAVYNYLASVGVCSLPAAESVIVNPDQQMAVFPENAPVINYLNTGGSAHYGQDRTFPGLAIGSDQNDFAVQITATISIPAPGNWTFGVNSDDGFSLSIGNFFMSYPDPRGEADTLRTFNFPAAGDYPLLLIFYECGGDAAVELYAAQGSYGGWDSTHFRLVGDTANGGLTVTAPLVWGGTANSGYRPFIQTDVQNQMSGLNSTAYLRIPFELSDPNPIQSLTLRIMYDDGFVAFLNGQEIARRNAPAAVQWNSAATASHPASQALEFEEVNVSDHLGALRTGNNVLAIQGLNQRSNDTDFLLVPELAEYQANGSGNRYFIRPSPGALNNSGFQAFVADTKFSVNRGFLATPFSLSITSATPDATIYYTTDGSSPSPGNGALYTGPLPIGETTVIRAAAFKDGYQPSNPDTQTYIFPEDVIRQSTDGAPPPGWPWDWGANAVDYGMDPEVVNLPAYNSEIVADLKAIPTFSIVMDSRDLFDPLTGIYANADQDGIAWERPASLELIRPDGQSGFHIDAGIRIRGGYSRSSRNPKHAFRFFFRSEYGKSKLDYPLFASQGGASSFDKFDLRTFENYSWSFEGDYRFIALRDQWSRDTQLAMGQPAERGDFYHLYINGQYWGLYNTCERPEAAFASAYLGGNPEDYDVVKVDTSANYTIFATDGNLDAWLRLWRAATNGFASDVNYFKIQGLNVDGTLNPAYENLLDVDNLIDHMLLIFFTGNIDAPISAFLGDQSPNNLYAFRDRSGQHGGFRFVAHDSEHTLLHESSLGNNDELHRNRTGPFSAGDPAQQGPASAFARSNPQYIFTRLTANAEFRIRVADHIGKRFFNGGALTTEACRSRFLVRSNEVYRAIACESARWGDAKIAPPRTRNVDWVREMNRVYGDYFASRPGIVLAQLRAKGWYPNLAAPTFDQPEGVVNSGSSLGITATSGTIYYTRDGSDPRTRGGAISSSALIYSSPIILDHSAQIRARAFDGATWSSLREANFYVRQTFTDLLITEIMYHPPGAADFGPDDFEFIELKNVSASTLELSGVYFSNGIEFTFPIGSFAAPGQFLVLVGNPAAFTNRYPGVRVDGVYQGKLSDQGEKVVLSHVTGTNIFSVAYGTRLPWPETADGAGFSLAAASPNFNPDPADPGNWRASSSIGGSPGRDDVPGNIPPIFINEVLTHTDLPQLDSIELRNPNSTNVDIGNWYLTDQRTQPRKFRISSPTIIPGNGYKLFTEEDWNLGPPSTNHFRFDSHGEAVYLHSGDASGNLTGFSDGFTFGPAQNGVAFGRYIISTGAAQYPAQRLNTLGSANAGPRVGPVVINEIHYHPPPGGDEFVELKSLTNIAVKLYDQLYPTNTWRLHGAGFVFPTNAEIAPNGLAVVAALDPTFFRAKYSVPAEVPVWGPYVGRLQGSGEALALQCPDHPDIDTNSGAIFVPYFDIDVVRYEDHVPWPIAADGLGASLERLDATAYGNDPVNWRASLSAPSPGLETTGQAPFPIQSIGLSGAPLSLQFQFTASAGHSYTVQFRDSLAVGDWLRFTNIPAQSPARSVQITDPILPGAPSRFYRIVSPQLP